MTTRTAATEPSGDAYRLDELGFDAGRTPTLLAVIDELGRLRGGDHAAVTADLLRRIRDLAAGETALAAHEALGSQPVVEDDW